MRTLVALVPALSCLALAAVPPLGGCAALEGNGADGGAEGSIAPSSTDAAAAAPATAQGADCALDPETGATLCTAISICPKIAVDHDVYPNCGFRVRGQTLDLECSCSGALCPVGTATTCDQAAALLAAQTETQVCTQIGEGRCVAGTPVGADAGSASGCDHQCASECAGDINCFKLCGC